MIDDVNIRKSFGRILTWAVVLVALAAVVYLTVGDQLLRFFYDGGSVGWLIPAHQPDSRTFEEYSRDSDVRFWSNVVVGIPLSIVLIYGLFFLYRALFRAVPLPPANRVAERGGRACHPGAISAAGIYAAATALWFAPVLPEISRALIGPPGDNMACLWTLAWANDHMFTGADSLTMVHDLFYPEGSSFVFHAWSYYNLFVFWCLRHFFEPVMSYNLLMLFTFPLAGLGGYLLTRYLAGSRWLALLAGFLFAFNPSHQIRADHHMNLASIQFIPLFVLFFIKAVRKESRWALVWAGCFLTLNALVDWNYLVYSCWFMLFGYLYLAVRRRQTWLPDVALKALGVTGFALLAVSPWMIPMLTASMSGLPAYAGGHNRFVIDLAAIVVPFANHCLSALNPVAWINQTYSSWPSENTGYLGIAALGLVILTWKEMAGRVIPYLIGAISFLIMSLGAQPHFLGYAIPALIPGRLVSVIPLVANSRAPARNMVFVYLFWSIIVALATGAVRRRITSPWFRPAVVGLLVTLLALDYCSVSRQTTPVTLPKCYSMLPKDPDQYGILDLPSGYRPVERYMMYQTLHGLPIVQGWVSRKLKPSLIDRLEMNDLESQRSQLTKAKVKYVVLHKAYLPDESVDTGRYQRVYSPVFEDDQTILLKVY